MDASIKKILQDLKARRFSPVYFLQGEETFYIDKISDFIEAHALSDAEKGFNQVVVYGKDSTVAGILTHARRFPMMADRQVVIVKEAQDIQDLNKDAGARLLLDYLTRPVPSTILVFCHKNKALDKRKELGKKIDALTTSITTKKLYDNQLPDFILEYASEQQLTIEDKAVESLCEFVGNDLHRIANELEKMTLSMTGERLVTAEMVMTQVGVSKEYNIFELQKAVLRRDNLLAFRIVNYFAANTRKNPVIPMVAFLYSFFSKLLTASTLQDRSERNIASELKISPFAARDYSVALRVFPGQKILANLGYLQEADLKLKGVGTGSGSDEAILKELIWKLIN